MKWFKRIVLALFVLFLLAQFVRPDFTNPPIDPAKEYRAPAHIQPILERACYDCHSSRTKLPWYSNISPVSWWLKDHINEAREELSFSEFNSYAPKKAAHKMEEVCEMVEKREMPLREYTWTHQEARLTDAERQTLCTWAKGEQQRISAAAGLPPAQIED